MKNDVSSDETNLSNREIARICGVSEWLARNVGDDVQDSCTSPEPETRIGADGKERRMPT